jgi:hypothetical protein
MDDRSRQVAERCLRGAQNDSMTFPQIVGKLVDDGFESYAVDYRRSTATYYRPDGDSIELPMQSHAVAIAEALTLARSRRRLRMRSSSCMVTPMRVSAKK